MSQQIRGLCTSRSISGCTARIIDLAASREKHGSLKTAETARRDQYKVRPIPIRICKDSRGSNSLETYQAPYGSLTSGPPSTIRPSYDKPDSVKTELLPFPDGSHRDTLPSAAFL